MNGDRPSITRTSHYIIVNDVYGEGDIYYLNHKCELVKQIFISPTRHKVVGYVRAHYDAEGYPTQINYTNTIKEVNLIAKLNYKNDQLISYEDNSGNWWDNKIMSEPIDEHFKWGLIRLEIEYKWMMSAMGRMDIAEGTEDYNTYVKIIDLTQKIQRLKRQWGT